MDTKLFFSGASMIFDDRVFYVLFFLVKGCKLIVILYEYKFFNYVEQLCMLSNHEKFLEREKFQRTYLKITALCPSFYHVESGLNMPADLDRHLHHIQLQAPPTKSQ